MGRCSVQHKQQEALEIIFRVHNPSFLYCVYNSGSLTRPKPNSTYSALRPLPPLD